GTPLSWVQRLKICIGAGRGLHYLHTGTRTDVGVVHRDVKSSNILLDESWVAKISDFGLSRISPINRRASYVNTLVKGTFGYLDPDYFYTGRLTRKSDVYAFGVVLLEVLCRKRAVDRSLDEDHWNLARWVQESIKEGNLKRIIDTDIRSQISPKCLKEFVRIADRCVDQIMSL
ncbi:receptor-like protein kinase FERONIA, partial [Tanacetum coccineum]